MVDIVTRAGKGSPLTNAEVDANFTNLAEVATVGSEPIGHEDITESTISFTAATRTFSIAPVGSSFTVWCVGNKHVFTTAQTVVIPNTTGLHYIYFGADGVLAVKQTYFTWDSDAPTAYIYWNSVTGAAVYFGDERHGVVLDWQTHEYLHRTRGAAIANGFAASGYTTAGAGDLDTDAQIAIEGGTFFDEDMQVDIVSTATPTANTWQQNLAFPAKIPVLHLQGTGWVLDTPTNFPLKQGTARPQYNLLSGGVWSTADVTNNKYGTTWILATNNLNYPVVAIIGQHQADSQGEAEATSFSSLNLPGFPSVEFRPLYKLVYNCADSNTNTPHAKIVSVIDLRSLSAANPAANPATDHGNLSGLVDDDHPQYVHISSTRTVSTAVKDSLLPTQTGNANKYLKTDGTTASWQDVTSANNGTLTLNTSGTGISGSATFSANQASAATFTVSSNATSANTASAIVARDVSGNFSAGTITAALSGNATTASTLATGRTIAMTGDVTYTSPSFNGSQNVTAAATLANSGVTAGTYGSSTAIPSITVDAKGRVTAASTNSISVGDGAFTVNTSTGLSGGGQLGTANQASATSITLTNTDRGSQQNIFKNIAVSGQSTVVADNNNDTLTLVGGSNVTITTDATTDTITFTASQPSVGNGSFTVNTGSGLTGGAQLGTANQTANTSITISHADTSTQASVNNSNGVVIQDVTLDDFGHVTGLASVDLDGRYAGTGHTHSQYIPINPDGDGNAWAYSDSNPTVNGVYIGGVQSFGADGVINGGALQSKLINAWNGFVNSSNGYYVGTRDFSADSLTYSTTKVIDSSANVFPGGSTGYLTNNSWNSVRVQSPSGYIDFGPANTSWAHIYTDRPAFYFNTDLYVLGNRVFHDGYHPNADKWTTARTNTVTLTGDVTGSGNASVDGSGNWTVSIPAVVANDSHSHSNYLPLAGGTMTGKINIDNPLDYSSTTLSGLTSAPLSSWSAYDPSVGTTTQFLPMTHQTAMYSSGYRTHLNTGLYKVASGWGDNDTGWYAALGGNDNYPTKYWKLTYGTHIYNSDGYVSQPGSFRAPIFYDLDDTNYYCDPRSTSRFSGLRLDGVDNNASGEDAILWINKPNNNDWAIKITGQLEYGIQADMASTHSYSYRALKAGSEYFRVGTDYLLHTTQLRAPIFYDYNDTSCYVDPNSNSVFKNGDIFHYRTIGAADNVRNGIRVYDDSAMATNVGGQLVLGYKYTSAGDYTEGAIIKMYKLNATSGDYSSGIKFQVRNTGELLSTKAWLEPTGTMNAATFNATSTTNGGFQGIDADTLTNPSFTWTADLNTGMYRYSTDTIGFSAGGNDEFRIYTSYTFSPGSSRAPIFYDSNSTSYYGDFASTSRMNAVYANNVYLEPSTSRAYGFWNSLTDYKIGMSTSSDSTNGGRLDTTSDYNMYFTMSSGTNRGFVFRNANAASGAIAQIDASGNLYLAGDMAKGYSDDRLKNLIGNIENALDKVCALDGFYYTPNEVAKELGKDSDKVLVGVSAQSVEAVLPEVVVDSPVGKGYKTVQYEKMVPLLIEAIKELQAQVKDLKRQFA